MYIITQPNAKVTSIQNSRNQWNIRQTENNDSYPPPAINRLNTRLPCKWHNSYREDRCDRVHRNNTPFVVFPLRAATARTTPVRAEKKVIVHGTRLNRAWRGASAKSVRAASIEAGCCIKPSGATDFGKQYERTSSKKRMIYLAVGRYGDAGVSARKNSGCWRARRWTRDGHVLRLSRAPCLPLSWSVSGVHAQF